MSAVWLSRNPQVQRVHHKFDIHEPKGCREENAKLSNISRQMAALREEHARLSRKDLNWEGSVILALTLIKETCYSFVDLAGAIAVSALGKTAGKKVQLWSTGLTGIMDMTEAYTSGRGASGVITEATSTSLSLIGKGPAGQSIAGKTTIFKGHQAITILELQKASKDKDQREAGYKRRSLFYNSGDFALDLLEEDLPSMKHLRSGIAVVKAVDRYKIAMEKAFDEFLSTEISDNMMRIRKQIEINRRIADIERLLESAQTKFNACMTN